MGRTAVDEASVRDRLEEILGDRSPGELALVARLTSGFEAKAGSLLQSAVDAVIVPDQEAAVRHVHTLRGSAANLGSVRLAASCGRLEEQLRAGRLSEVVAACQQLGEEVMEFVAVLGAVRIVLQIEPAPAQEQAAAAEIGEEPAPVGTDGLPPGADVMR